MGTVNSTPARIFSLCHVRYRGQRLDAYYQPSSNRFLIYDPEAKGFRVCCDLTPRQRYHVLSAYCKWVMYKIAIGEGGDLDHNRLMGHPHGLR